ncbi:MAG: MFS transporter [Acetobacteraceae bacterium]|nr:MFS transporter [Acetobacteraceae bacterium]
MTAQDADGLPAGRRGPAAACIAAGISVTVLDAAMVNVALPSAARDLGLTPSEAVWVVNAYQITVVGSLLPLAALGEIAGFRRVWLWGLALFIAGAFLCALAPSFEALLLLRVAQGLGGAAVMGLTGALVRHSYPMSQLGRGIAANALTVAACSAAGPSLGAAVLSVASWQWVFLAHLPIGLAALVAGGRLLPDPPPRPRPFDWAAAALTMGGFGCVFLGLDLLLHRPVLGGPILLAGLGLVALLVMKEMANAVPLLPLDLLRITKVRVAVGASVAMFAAHMVMLISLPFHLSGAGYSAAEIGLILTAYPVALGLLAPAAGRFADRVESAWPPILGAVLMALANLMLAALPAGGPLWPILGALILAGVGFGAFQAPNNRTMLAAAPRARAGSAGGMQSTARVLGQSIGATAAAFAFAGPGPAAGFATGIALALVSAAVNLLRR